jgi:hypothetical protein
VQVMQQWYEETAERITPQTRTLQEFLTSHNIQLRQITEDHKDMLDERHHNRCILVLTYVVKFFYLLQKTGVQRNVTKDLSELLQAFLWPKDKIQPDHLNH